MGQKAAYTQDEIAGPDNRHTWNTRLIMTNVERDKPRALRLGGSHQDREIFCIGKTMICHQIRRQRIRYDM